jgi:hypothetical protein
MGNELIGGDAVFDPYTDPSMAAAIERHLNTLLATPLPPEDTPEARERRRFLAAISRGVIEHLSANPDAFEVVFTSVPGGLNAADFGAVVQVRRAAET